MIDAIWEVVVFVIGLVIGLIFLINKKLPELRKQFVSKYGIKYSEHNPYDKMNDEKLEKMATKLLSNYVALITIYGFLLAFVVSDKIALSLSSMYFVVWCGWIIAVIVKMGKISLDLFDLNEISPREKIIKQIYAYREFFKNALYLLIPLIAVMPVFFLEPMPTLDELNKLPWPFGYTLLSGAVAIICSTSLFYFTAFDTKIIKRLFQNMIGFTISFVIVGVTTTWHFVSPVTPSSTLFLSESYQVPLILQILLLAGSFFGAMMILYLCTALSMLRKEPSQSKQI